MRTGKSQLSSSMPLSYFGAQLSKKMTGRKFSFSTYFNDFQMNCGGSSQALIKLSFVFFGVLDNCFLGRGGKLKFHIISSLFIFSLFFISCSQNGTNSSASTAPRGKIKPEDVKKLFDAENGCFRDGIVGGEKVNASNPRKNHVVLLWLTDHEGNQSICTGVLLTKKIVLTAAHCADGADLKVFFSPSVYCSKGMNKNLIFSTNKILIHPQWVKDIQDVDSGALNQANSDLALVQLSMEAPFPYAPIGLGTPQELSKSSEILQIGYGRTQTSDSQLPELREVSKTAAQIKYLDHSQYLVVDQRNGKGGCPGDSGGPLMINVNGTYKVAGIASYLINYKDKDLACETGELAYDSAADYAPWILDGMKQLK